MNDYESPKIMISKFSEETIVASANTPENSIGNTPENKFEDNGQVATIPDINFP